MNLSHCLVSSLQAHIWHNFSDDSYKVESDDHKHNVTQLYETATELGINSVKIELSTSTPLSQPSDQNATDTNSVKCFIV